MLLGLLQEYVSSITVDGGAIKLVDMPPVVCSLYWVHQQEAKVNKLFIYSCTFAEKYW